MNKEIIHKIKVVLESEIGGLQSSIQKVTDLYGRLGGEIEGIGHKLQDIITKTPQGAQQFGVGTLTSQAGVVSGIGGAGGIGIGKPIEYATASLEKLSKVAASVAKDLEDVKNKQLNVIASLADASDTQKKVALQDLNQLQGRERELMNLRGLLSGLEGGGRKGGGMGGLLSGLLTAFGASALIGGAGRGLTWGVGLSMSRMGAESAYGATLARSTQALGGFGLEDIARLDEETMHGAYSTGFRTRSAQSKIGYGVTGAVAGVGGALALGALGGKIGGATGSLLGPLGTLGGAALGAVVGIVGGLIINEMSAASQKAGVGGYEEYIQNAINKMGGKGVAIRTAQQLSTSIIAPIQLAYGLGRGSELGIGENLRRVARLTGMSMGEIGGAEIGLGGMGFGYRQLNQAGGVLDRISTAGVNLGLRPTEMARFATGFLGAGFGTAGMDVNMALQVAQAGKNLGIGDDRANAELMKRYLTTSSQMMQNMGGGLGAGGVLSTGNIMTALLSGSENPALAIAKAPALAQTVGTLMGQQGGLGRYLNILGAGTAMERISGAIPGFAQGLSAHPMGAMLMQNLMSGDLSTMENFFNGLTPEQLSGLGMTKSDVANIYRITKEEKFGSLMRHGIVGRLFPDLVTKIKTGEKLTGVEELAVGTQLEAFGVPSSTAMRISKDVGKWLRTSGGFEKGEGDIAKGITEFAKGIAGGEDAAKAEYNLQMLAKGVDALRRAVDERTPAFIAKIVDQMVRMVELSKAGEIGEALFGKPQMQGPPRPAMKYSKQGLRTDPLTGDSKMVHPLALK